MKNIIIGNVLNIKYIVTLIIVLFSQLNSMSGQIDYTKILGNDTTEIFGPSSKKELEPSAKIGIQYGHLIEPGKTYSVYQVEFTLKLTNGIDGTLNYQSWNNSIKINSISTVRNEKRLLGVGLTFYPLRNKYVNPYMNLRAGPIFLNMGLGVKIPLHFIGSDLDIRYQTFPIPFNIPDIITFGVNIGL